MISASLQNWWQISVTPGTATIIFTLVGGLVVCVGTHSVDFINRILFTGKIIFLIIMLAVMMPHVNMTNLVSMPIQNGLVLSAIPLVFTSFGFHGSVPSPVNYMNGDSKSCALFSSLVVLFRWWRICCGRLRPSARSRPIPSLVFWRRNQAWTAY